MRSGETGADFAHRGLDTRDRDVMPHVLSRDLTWNLGSMVDDVCNSVKTGFQEGRAR